MRNSNSGSTFSVIGPDVIITGNIEAKVDLHIDGRIEGDIRCASLVQGESSTIQGSVVTQTARLAGKVDGSIDANELIVERSANIAGDVAYETLQIEQGGHVDGQFKHKSRSATTAQVANGGVGDKVLDLQAKAKA